MDFINLRAQYQQIENDINKRVLGVLRSGKYILGDAVEEFEGKLADYVGRKHAVTCGNGTDALQLIYMAYDIGKGDAVFCPDMTFIASIEPAVMLGAHPFFCDIDRKYYNIDPLDLEKKIKRVISEGKYTPRAIVAVDFLGQPFDYDKIAFIAKKYNLLLIEDAAQGMGAHYFGRMCGSLGDISATSFFPTKPLGCYGDGGAVFTDDDRVYGILKSLRVHGKGKDKYHNVRIGMNSRLDTIQAAILLQKIEILENEIIQRQKIASRYDKKLSGYVNTPVTHEKCRSSFAQYIITVDGKDIRDRIVKYLKRMDIPTLFYYPNPLHRMEVFDKEICEFDSYDNTEWYCDCSIGIPFSPYITEDEQDMVVNGIIEAIKEE